MNTNKELPFPSPNVSIKSAAFKWQKTGRTTGRILNRNVLTQVITGNFAGSLGECGSVGQIVREMWDKYCLQSETNIVQKLKFAPGVNIPEVAKLTWS